MTKNGHSGAIMMTESVDNVMELSIDSAQDEDKIVPE